MKKIANEKKKDKYPCPSCGKRVFDARDGDTAVITLKCPHCKQIVDVPVFARDKSPPDTIHSSYG